MEHLPINKIDYVAPIVLQESIPVDKAVIETLCKD
jgi:hypothetical protein